MAIQRVLRVEPIRPIRLEIRRQGDILTVRMDGLDLAKLTRLPRERGDVVLAHGEATGHTHRFCSPSTQLFAPWPTHVTDARQRLQHARELVASLPVLDPMAVVVGVLDLAEPDDLVHEEHGAIRHEAGQYVVLRQREYAPGTASVVSD